MRNDIMEEITLLMYAICLCLFIWVMFEWVAVLTIGS